MKKRYIVCVNNSNKEKDNLFIDYLKQNGLGWWHYLDNFWLLTDSSGKFSAAEIRNQLNIIYSARNIVIEINQNSDSWAGFGPNNEKENMFDWIDKNWKK